MSQVAVFGASSEIATALLERLAEDKLIAQVDAVSRSGLKNLPRHHPAHSSSKVRWHEVRDDHWLEDIEQLLGDWAEEGRQLDEVWSLTGWLHSDQFQPERRIESLSEKQLTEYFRVNTIYPALLLKQLKPLLPTKSPARVLQLGAKVGSIGDNRLGGWYGYRSSKAALNMLWKTAAIEFRRTHSKLVLGIIHPGTTDTQLSKPFQKRIPENKLYTPQQTAERLLKVGRGLKASDSGEFWFWDGTRLPW